MTTTIDSSTLRSDVETLVSRIRDNDETAAEELQKRLLAANTELGSTKAVEDVCGDLIDEAARLDAFRHGGDNEVETDEVKTEIKDEATANWERRQKISVIFGSTFSEAAEAITTELENADGKTLNWVNQSLFEALYKKEALQGRDEAEKKRLAWARAVTWSHCNRAREMAQAGSEEKAMVLLNYLEQNVGSIVRMLEFRLGTPDDVKRNLLERAGTLINKVYFPAYVIFAIERLIERAKDGENNCVSAYFRRNGEMAGIVYAAPEKKRASALIERIKGPAVEAMASVHIGPMRPGKTERDRKRAEEREPRNRSEEDRKYREAMKGRNPEPPKYGKGKNR